MFGRAGEWQRGPNPSRALNVNPSLQPFLPPELFRSDGPWVCLSAYSAEPTAIAHFSGRSRFLVFMRLPGGRDTTLAYIHKLRSSSEPPLLNSSSPSRRLNLALPQVPEGTMVAPVRQMMVIDDQGKLTLTALTEGVQLRVYHAITPGTEYMNYSNGPSSHDQDFLEFRIRRQDLFARHSVGLRSAPRRNAVCHVQYARHRRLRVHNTFGSEGGHTRRLPRLSQRFWYSFGPEPPPVDETFPDFEDANRRGEER